MSKHKKPGPAMLANFGTVAKRVHPNRILEEISNNNDNDIDVDIDKDINIKDDINRNNGIQKDSQNDTEEVDNTQDTLEPKGTKDILNEVSKSKKAAKKRQMLVYVDSDVADAMDKFARKIGKGAKSQLVNQLLRDAFDLDNE